VTVSETRIAQPRYAEFMTLPQQQRMAPEDDNRRFFDLVSTVDRGSVGPV